VILLGFSQDPCSELKPKLLASGKFSVDVNILAGKQQQALQEGPMN